MEAFLIYLLKSAILIALVWSCYQLFLANDTHFSAHRWFLIIGLLLATVLPLITFTQTIYLEASPIGETLSEISSPATREASVDWLYYFGVLYVLGSCFFLGRTLVQFTSMHRLIASGRTFKENGVYYVEIERSVSPFSFLNYIVYNPSLYAPKELKAIMEHERIHVKDFHSMDVFLTLALLVLQWFNPFAWLFKGAVQQNLEFIADRDTLNTGVGSKE